MGRLLEVIDLASLERVHRSLRIRHGQPFQAIDLYDFASRRPVRRLGARLVAIIAHIDCFLAGFPFTFLEDEWTGTGRDRKFAEYLAYRLFASA